MKEVQAEADAYIDKITKLDIVFDNQWVRINLVQVIGHNFLELVSVAHVPELVHGVKLEQVKDAESRS